ncbi:sugar phosphate isomerase/epimerase family protein [Polymorphospora sp. NPDC051019]|uniref:sugar phosphate isomerase/epimerase family protein n=1 Tax=Polymorphospora sp. NPDC051019 TaxID=3155725 RepID=UPI00344463B1
MKPQPFRVHDQRVVRAFVEARRNHTADEPKLKFGWSNWGFGTEDLAVSAARLSKNGVRYIELHGNLYSEDLGYKPDETLRILGDHGITVSGICGMVTPNQEFAHNLPHVRARAIEYFRRQARFAQAVGGSYLLFGAASVGRPTAFDSYEVERSAQTMKLVADDFAAAGIRGAVEPIRPEETSIVHTFEQALRLLELVDHPAISHLNGDLYHMLSGELHIGATILDHGHRMLNLHMADSNRRALGHGLLDLDVIIMALYAIGYQRGDNYCSAEPLGAGGNPYAAMNLPPQTDKLDELVRVSAETFREREEEVLGASDEELFALYQIDSE